MGLGLAICTVDCTSGAVSGESDILVGVELSAMQCGLKSVGIVGLNSINRSCASEHWVESGRAGATAAGYEDVHTALRTLI